MSRRIDRCLRSDELVRPAESSTESSGRRNAPTRTARVSGIRWGVPALRGIVDSTLQPRCRALGLATLRLLFSRSKMVAKRLAKVWTSPGQRAET